MDLQELVHKAFAVDSVWSVVLLGAIWLIISLLIVASVDNPNSNVSSKELQANLGFFTMFLLLFGGLIYLLFGFGTQ